MKKNFPDPDLDKALAEAGKIFIKKLQETSLAGMNEERKMMKDLAQKAMKSLAAAMESLRLILLIDEPLLRTPPTSTEKYYSKKGKSTSKGKTVPSNLAQGTTSLKNPPRKKKIWWGHDPKNKQKLIKFRKMARKLALKNWKTGAFQARN